MRFGFAVPEVWRGVAQWAAWIVCAAWLWRTKELVERLPEVADLVAPEWEFGPAQGPTLAVIVPAKDEEANIRATLTALAMTEYPRMRVVVVDDRSTDATGTIAEEFAERHPGLIEVVHIAELPEGWLGKTWAMDVAMSRCRDVDYVLFTDADVLLSPSVLWRALGYAEATEADHLVVYPTPLVRGRGEGIVLGFFQVLGVWAIRPWLVADAWARRDVAGVGAFNMVRRAAFEEIGGWMPQRMVVLEDVTLGRRMKAAGMRQRVAFAPGMVLVHWAPGMRGVVRVMTKNLFSAVNFQPLLMLAMCAWVTLFCLGPVVGLFWVKTTLPCLIVMTAVGASYRELGDVSGIDARYGWAFPLGAVAMIAAMLRSMAVVTLRRGVKWRGTFYPLAELRQFNSPFQWEREAAELRDRLRRERPSRLRVWVDARKRKKR